MIKLCDLALDELERHPGRSVIEMTVEIGELTGVLPKYLQKYYPTATKGTPLEGSVLNVIAIEAESVCLDCHTHYHPDRNNDYRCPGCGGINARFIHGRELNLRSLSLSGGDIPG